MRVRWLKNLFGSIIYIYYICIVDLRERGYEEESKTEKFIWRFQ
jgi:hypothetical protein